jgi:creatinine amidohydrolase/Fe(II)-dependent formamide hydrolase-like protein
MTWPEVERAIAGGADTALLMTASIEQNGPHLSLDKHVVLGRHVAVALARRHPGVLVAPLVPVGRADEHLGFPGTLSVSEDTFARTIGDLVASLGRSGFRRVILMGDHGPNRESLARLAPGLDAAGAPALPGPRVAVVGTCYGKADALMEKELVRDGVVTPGTDHSSHAGLLDTAMLMAVSPDRVRTPLPARPGPLKLDDAAEAKVQKDGIRAVSQTGILGDPRRATPALGRRALQLLIDTCAEELRATLAALPPR